MRSTALNWNAKGVLCALANMNRNGRCNPRRSVLMAATGLRLNQVKYALDDLRKLGLITSTKGQRSNAYIVADPEDWGKILPVKNQPAETNPAGEKSTGAPVKNQPAEPPYLLMKRLIEKKSVRPAASISTRARGRKAAAQTPPPAPTAKAAKTKQPGRAQNGFGPHSLDKVETVRLALASLGDACHLPPPDDGILRAVLEACGSAPVEVIVRNLRGLYQRGRFRNMRSWGLVPIALKPWCQAVGA